MSGSEHAGDRLAAARGGAEAAPEPSPPHRYDRVRRFGWWYFAEMRIRAMRAFLGFMAITGIGTPVLYILAFGLGLALVVDATRPEGLEGVSYLTFLAPALMLSGSMMVASEDATYGVFGGFTWNPITVAATTAPITPRQAVLGFLVSNVVKCLPNAIVFFLLMWLVGAIPSPTGPLVLLVDVLLVLAIAAPVMAWVAAQKHDRGQLSFIQRFVMTPFMLFSGTYFPLAALPAWLQWIGWISPLWHAVELGRWATFGMPIEPWLAAVHVLVLVAFAVGGTLLAFRTFERRLVS